MVADKKDSVPVRKVGIFGGSFDPVHNGHIGLAKDAAVQIELDKVIFIPARLQPFKLDRKVTDGRHRLAILLAAVSDDPVFEVSDHELRSQEISYTYLTMRAMQRRFGCETKLYFLTGTDAFLKIEQWKNAEEMLRSYAYIVGSRPGYRQKELSTCAERIRARYRTEVNVIDNVQIDVSSTEIRDRLRSGETAADLLPAGAERYIKDHGLYR